MILTVLGIVAVLYAALCAVVYVAQTKFIFPGGRMTDRTPSMPPFGWQYEDLYLDVGSEKTNAWFIANDNARGVVLFSHGNGGALSDWIEAVIPLRELGFSVLIYDYGGYGRSSGRATEQRCYADIRAIWKHLTGERGIPPGKILLFGRSLGGGVTAQLATEVSPGAVILESTFLSVADLAREMIHILPMKLLIWNRFDTVSKLGQIHAPVLVVHSSDDTMIPYQHGVTLFERANEPKQFLQIRGDHNEGVFVSRQGYERGLERFVAAYFPPPSSS